MPTKTYQGNRSVSQTRKRFWLTAALLASSSALSTNVVRGDDGFAQHVVSPINRAARFMGWAYSDGYHASMRRSHNPLLDAPPRSLWLSQQIEHNQHQRYLQDNLIANGYNHSVPTWVQSTPTLGLQFDSQFAPQAVPHGDNYNGNPQGSFGGHTYVVPPSVEPTFGDVPDYTPLTPAENGKSDFLQDRRPNIERGDTGDLGKDEPKIESVPAPQPEGSKANDEAEKSPSDRMPDPPSGSFFDRDSTQKLLEGLEDLGNPGGLPPAADPLLPDKSTPAVIPPSTGTSEDDLLSGYSPQSSPYFTPRSARRPTPRIQEPR